jgi:hypothetical protein
MAALPDRGAGAPDQTMVMFAPGIDGAAAFNALAKVDARGVGVDRSGRLWAVTLHHHMKRPSASICTRMSFTASTPDSRWCHCRIWCSRMPSKSRREKAEQQARPLQARTGMGLKSGNFHWDSVHEDTPMNWGPQRPHPS